MRVWVGVGVGVKVGVRVGVRVKARVEVFVAHVGNASFGERAEALNDRHHLLGRLVRVGVRVRVRVRVRGRAP